MLPVAGHSSEILIAAALRYVETGYSVLPLIGGDAPEPKKPAILSWKEYQTRQPRQDEIEEWFGKQGFQGLGIITGPISHLAVLDFDILRLIDRFEANNPKLKETLRVLTRRGCHLYFRTRRDDQYRNRKLNGIEFRYEGLYVVAPPTVIAGHEYVTTGNEKPLFLTEMNWLAIQRFMDEVERENKGITPHPLAPSPTRRKGESEKRGSQTEAVCIDESLYKEVANTALSVDAVRKLYLKLAREEGRNEGLFHTCLAARDAGWAQISTEHHLLPMFIHSAPIGHHCAETPMRRQREGCATIGSAFSHPPRPHKFDTPQLYTSIREALLKRGYAPLVRVLEGLRLKGIQPGQTFTRLQAIMMLKGIVGRDAVDAALKTTLEGQPIFVLAPSLPAPISSPKPANAARSNATHPESNASVSQTKSGKNRRGRPPLRYTMPDNAQLCALLGVEKTSSDPLNEDDLRSSKAVRQAIHRALIKRRPGMYTVRWLAQRLSVSEREVRRYNRQIEDLHSAPTFFAQPVTWSSLNVIPDAGSNGPGFLLEDQFHKRYPAVQGLARKLLKRGYKLQLLRQQANTYWVGEAAAPPVSVMPQPKAVQTRVEWEPKIVPLGEHVRRLIQTVEQRREAPPQAKMPEVQKTDAKHGVPTAETGAKWSDGKIPHAQKRVPTTVEGNAAPPPPKPPPKPPVDYRRFWHPLDDPDEEYLAQKIYDAVNRLTKNKNERVSKAAARKWVYEYGERLVRMALEKLERRQHAIYKPAGFVKTVLRSTKKFAFGYDWVDFADSGRAEARPSPITPQSSSLPSR